MATGGNDGEAASDEQQRTACHDALCHLGVVADCDDVAWHCGGRCRAWRSGRVNLVAAFRGGAHGCRVFHICGLSGLYPSPGHRWNRCLQLGQ